MPNPRFWEMENRQINLGQFNAKMTDPLLLLFADLGLIYGNDWFVILYAMQVAMTSAIVAPGFATGYQPS